MAGLQKYDPTKVSTTRKVIYTIGAVLLAPYTILLSLLFIQYVWYGRMPFSKKGGKGGVVAGRIVLYAILAVALAFIVAVVVFNRPSAQTTAAVATPVVNEPFVPPPIDANTIFAQVNTERTKQGLKPLVRDARLDKSAQLKADDMTKNGYYGHTNPTTQKHGYTFAIETTGNLCSYVGENLNIGAIGYPERLVSSWMLSTAHRNAILNPDYALTGVAVSGDLAVQHFCIPL